MKSTKTTKIIQVSILLLIVAAIILFVVLIPKKDTVTEKEGFYFDTVVNIRVYSSKDAKYLDDCMDICQKYENLFSRTKEDSDIYNINHSDGQSVEVDPDTYFLLSKSLEFCEETNGAVDITVAPLMDAWGFTAKSAISKLDSSEDLNGIVLNTSKPSDETLNALLENVDYHNVILEDSNHVRLSNPNSQVDLGFIAKGFIADKLKEYLVENSVEHAVISLGGNIVVIGSKPDGSDYNIGIKDPDNTGDIIDSVKVSDKSIVTSGTYERYIEYDGIKYHHILDTKTGYPVDNNIKSVTILSDSSMEGDALSTICLILGEEKSKLLLDKYNSKAIFY